MDFNVGCVDGYLFRRSRQGRRQSGEQILPVTFLRPAVIAVKDRRRWAVLWWTVSPPATRLEHMDNAADDPPIILAATARRTVRQMRLDQFKLTIR